VQDIVLRVDRAIGTLVDHLDATVGREHYVLALSADHGVAPIPEQVPGAGRRTSRDVAAAIDAALVPLYGEPKGPPPRAADAAAQPPPRASYMAYSAYTDVYLDAGLLDRLRGDERAREAVRTSLKNVPGIAHVFTRDEISAPAVRTDADPVKRAAALSFHPDRSGDLILVPREYWIFSSSATTHGTLYPYDQRVPIVLLGRGVTAGRYRESATPADIAPTLGALAGQALPGSDGRVLREAMARPGGAK
jgi:arylsulfatase A-like enzyme